MSAFLGKPELKTQLLGLTQRASMEEMERDYGIRWEIVELAAELQKAGVGGVYAAIEPGADLSRVWPQYGAWLLEQRLPHAPNGNARAAVNGMIERCGRWDEQTPQWREASLWHADNSLAAALGDGLSAGVAGDKLKELLGAAPIA